MRTAGQLVYSLFMRGWAIGALGVCSLGAVFAIACGSSDDDATSSADAGTSADGGGLSDSAVPPATDGQTPPGPSGPIDPAAAARAAVFLASCMSDDGINRTLQEIYLERTTLPFRSAAVLACLASKTNGCAAITECLGVKYGSDGPCDGGCAGSVYEECSGSTRLSIDCARMGLDCKPVRGGYCGGADAVTCDGTTFQGTCVDGTPTGCEDGLTRRGLHCPDFGATCALLSTTQPGGGTTFGCKGAGGACTGTNNDDTTTARWEGVRCEAGKLVGCLSNGLATLDCATSAIGFTCFDSPDGGAGATAYCGTASECLPKSPWQKVAATCEGTSVVICNGGKIEKLDCASLGFTGCNAGVCTPGFF